MNTNVDVYVVSVCMCAYDIMILFYVIMPIYSIKSDGEGLEFSLIPLTHIRGDG